MIDSMIDFKSEAILIKNGRLLDPSRSLDQSGDLLIEGGLIAAIGKPGEIPASRAKTVLDANGQWVLPGLIDAHVHLREPGMEYKETIATGTLAAVAGGFTSVACMANTQPVNDTPYVTAFIRERAKQTGACRVFPIGAASKGLKGEEIAEIGGMVEEGARAISDDGMPIMNSYLMRKVMDYSKAFDVAVISHSEDASLVGQGAMNEGPFSNSFGLRGSPAAAEEIMVARDIALCRLTRCRLHLAHISTELALEHLRRAKEAGLPVTAEASPHHLLLTDGAVEGYDTNFKMCPPLRSETDVLALRKAVKEGWVELIATDHAPHGEIEKAVEFDQAANGIIGLETAVAATLRLVHDGTLPLMRWLEALTTNPARMLGVPHGTLQTGRAADVTLLDPNLTWTLTEDEICSKSRNTPFMNEKFKGRVTSTIVGGKVAFSLRNGV